jgi:hypothetical protein
MNGISLHGVPDPYQKYPDQWIVWDRGQTKVIASGRTFEEAKRAAAARGASSVILAKAPPRASWSVPGRHLIYMVAVFISQVSALGMM